MNLSIAKLTSIATSMKFGLIHAFPSLVQKSHKIGTFQVGVELCKRAASSMLRKLQKH